MKNERLHSLDALRGFDMLFIMGFAGLVVVVDSAFPSTFGSMMAQQMKHVDWDGFAHHDMIFPLFLFIAGISFPFSWEKQKSSGLPSAKIYYKIIKRGIVLVLLGLLYNGILNLDFSEVRYASVLGRIGLAWMLGAIIYMNTPKIARYTTMAVILVGYSLLITLLGAPDYPNASPLSLQGNLVGYIDRLFLPGKLITDNMFDPEGILSTLPAIVTALLGMCAGEWVRKEKLSSNKKTFLLLGAGVILCIVGLVWNEFSPINKKLWSSSFVCFVGGLSFLLFALFYYIIDVKGYYKWTLFFRVIGLNSITIYLAQRIIGFTKISEFFFGGFASLFSEPVGIIIIKSGYVACCWIFLYFLYRHKIFLKV